MNPVFSGVTVSNATDPVETEYVDFIGTYSPTNIYTAEKTNLYLGSGNTLYYPETGVSIGAFRAYFQLKNGLTASPNPSKGGEHVRAFVLNFGDDSLPQGGDGEGLGTNAQPMFNLQSSMFNEEAWYSLDGRKLDKRPAKAGLYIHGGNKVVIK